MLPFLVLTISISRTPNVELCVVPATRQIFQNATCENLGAQATSSINVAGLRGERENVQLLLRLLPGAASSATLTAISTSGVPITVRQVAYVKTLTTTRYIGSGGGWRPDPLLPMLPKTTLRPGEATLLWLSIDLPANMSTKLLSVAQGAVLLTVSLNGAAQPIQLSVPVVATFWPMGLPSRLEIHRDFGEIWSFDEGDLMTVYGDNYSATALERYRAIMSTALLPPDHLYKTTPASAETYSYLAKQAGAYLLNLADIGTDRRGCPSPYSPSEINATLTKLAPAIASIAAIDPTHAYTKPYVYGYDEQPASCEPNIRALFGAVKARWPHVATAAVLNWEGGLPADLPLDIWIVQYEDLDVDAAARWKNASAGHKLFLYHCIEPSGGAYLNTFIERPRVQGRLLYWMGVMEGADGWLYYATDLWRPHPGKVHKPIRRINGTMLTDFDPSNYIWAPRTDIFANGDGQFLYPGVRDDDGTPEPIASARLELQRDAVEDAVLLRAAQKELGPEAVAAHIRTVVRSPTDHTDDPLLLEATRRAIAAALFRLPDPSLPR